jgi:hypothetical protein
MNEVNQNKPTTIRGFLTNIRSVPTQTGTAFVVCKIGEHKCKLFGNLAKLILANQYEHEGQETEADGHWDVKRGNEFVIDSFKTQPVQAGPKPVSDTRPPSTRYQWNLRSYGSNVDARRVGEWLNEFFDSLTEEEWHQWQMPKYKHSGLFPASEEELQVCRTWRDCNTSPPAMPQDLESVKTRFNARLGVIRDDLRPRGKSKATAPPAKTPATARSAELPPPEEKSSMQSVLYTGGVEIG